MVLDELQRGWEMLPSCFYLEQNHMEVLWEVLEGEMKESSNLLERGMIHLQEDPKLQKLTRYNSNKENTFVRGSLKNRITN